MVASVVTEAKSRYGLVLFGNVAQEYDTITVNFCCPAVNNHRITYGVHIRHVMDSHSDIVYDVAARIAPALRRLAEVRDAQYRY